MKSFNILLGFIAISLCSSTAVMAQHHSLVSKWETDTLLKTPESVLYDAKDKILYVSCIDGVPNEKDGKGGIAKVGLDGKIINASWVTGLNAPKGMGMYKNKLYVADLTEVLVIDMATAQVLQHIPVDGSVFLNDITIDKKGAVWVSDTRANKVYKIDKGIATPVFQNMQGPNGLLAVGDELMILDKGSLLKMVNSGNLGVVAEGMDPSTDGIEMVQTNEFLVTSWAGVIYYIYANGNKQTLLDSREKKINTADIGYDPKNRIVYVPTFYRNTVAAYELK